MYLRASQINGCSYCIDLYSHDSRAAGLSIEKLMLVSAASAQFTEKERVDLTLGIGLINAYNRMAIAFRRPADPLAD